jgi:hypothetical protein
MEQASGTREHMIHDHHATIKPPQEHRSGTPVNGHVEPFAWMTRDLLGDAIEIYAILDRDYRTDEQVYDVMPALGAAGVHPHVWMRKELESYLIAPSAIARITDVSEAEVVTFLEQGVQIVRDDVFANFVYERKKS